jgi:hypothetical protein
MSINISNSWIIGCSILTCGIMSYSYLNSINNLQIIHMKHKYMVELKKIENSINLTNEIKNEDILISYYRKQFNFVFILGITGISLVAFGKYTK